jgi:hypothetical protein
MVGNDSCMAAAGKSGDSDAAAHVCWLASRLTK